MFTLISTQILRLHNYLSVQERLPDSSCILIQTIFFHHLRSLAPTSSNRILVAFQFFSNLNAGQLDCVGYVFRSKRDFSQGLMILIQADQSFFQFFFLFLIYFNTLSICFPLRLIFRE